MINLAAAVTVALLVAAGFSTWLARKANMTAVHGMTIGGVGGLASFTAVVFAAGWLEHLSLGQLVPAVALLTTALCSAFVFFRFYRDPERMPPSEPNIVVSPADGTIVYIREVVRGQIPHAIKGRVGIPLREISNTDIGYDDLWLVGIGMTLIDVHVNRAPIAGEVVLRKHTSGRFLSLKDPEALTRNTRNTVVIKSGDGSVGMVQITSKQVRRISCLVSEGDRVDIGQRVGAILLGSQVDLVIPRKNSRVVVVEGQRVVAGETVIARFGDGLADLPSLAHSGSDVGTIAR